MFVVVRVGDGEIVDVYTHDQALESRTGGRVYLLLLVKHARVGLTLGKTELVTQPRKTSKPKRKGSMLKKSTEKALQRMVRARASGQSLATTSSARLAQP